MKIVDTNYLVRLFTQTPEALAQQALVDLASSEPHDVRLPDYVVSELLYVLEFHPSLSYRRQQIVDGTRLILSHPTWKYDEELHHAALTIYEAKKLDYVDCLVVAEQRLGRADKIFSFDRGMQKAAKA